ncbi:hypothetical protein ABZS79_20740 [Streptomyces griseoloalbus]|uniref:hypothetical protein n=1 Tax=Streptomyces griseoloalbus TaxID=67303 RepID=UPI0033A396E3
MSVVPPRQNLLTQGPGVAARPAKLPADRSYDVDHARNWLPRRQIEPRNAHRGEKISGRHGRHRWFIEHPLPRLDGCRRPHRRYEREAERMSENLARPY